MTTTTTTTMQRRRKRAVSMASLPCTWLGNVGLDTTPTLSGGNVQYTLNHRRGWQITRTSVLARVYARTHTHHRHPRIGEAKTRGIFTPLFTVAGLRIHSFVYFYLVLTRLVKHFIHTIVFECSVQLSSRSFCSSMKVGMYPRWFYVDDLRVAALIASPRKSRIDQVSLESSWTKLNFLPLGGEGGLRHRYRYRILKDCVNVIEHSVVGAKVAGGVFTAVAARVLSWRN